MANMINICQLFISSFSKRVSLPNFRHFLVGEFCPSVPHSPWGAFRVSILTIFFTARRHLWMFVHRVIVAAGKNVSAFSISIMRIIGICTQPQMSGIAAGRIIARMANKETAWNSAVCQFVSYAMRPESLTVKHKKPIAVLEMRPLPFPAFVRASDINMRPKAGNYGIIIHSALAPFSQRASGRFNVAAGNLIALIISLNEQVY